MGSVTYDFLADSLFFNKNGLKNKFKNESDSRIEKELFSYREHCIKNIDQLVSEIKDYDSSLKVFSSAEDTPYQLLKQTALYVDQFIINDPLFRFTDVPSDISNVTGEYLGYNQSGINRISIFEASSILKNVTPMVVANYLKVFPLSYYFETPKTIPLNIPVDYYNNILPKSILDFFREKAIVKSMQKLSEGGWMIDPGNLYPCRGIVVDFKDANFRTGMLYHLFEVQYYDLDKSNGTVKFRQYLPDTAPSIEEFENWVNQSINKTSEVFFNKIYNETYIASSLNATYLCDDQFTNEVVSRNFDVKDTINTYTASQIMNLDLPFIDKIEIQKLMDIRANQVAFTNFRLELEKSFRDLRSVTDPIVLKQKTENIFHELNDVQGQKIKTSMSTLKQKALANSILGIAGLTMSIQTGGWSVMATAAAAAKGSLDYFEYKEKVKNNPAYFLWRCRK